MDCHSSHFQTYHLIQVTVDQFIDVIEGNRAYIPVLYVFNKIDSITIEELDILDQMPNYVPISSRDKWNMEELMEEIWNKCNMLRIYTKPKGQKPDYEEPVILHSAKNPSVEEFCNRIHRSLMTQFSHAWVWGKSCDEFLHIMFVAYKMFLMIDTCY